MLKIEVIKFETQDVVTASVACICTRECYTAGALRENHIEDYCHCQSVVHKVFD